MTELEIKVEKHITSPKTLNSRVGDFLYDELKEIDDSALIPEGADPKTVAIRLKSIGYKREENKTFSYRKDKVLEGRYRFWRIL